MDEELELDQQPDNQRPYERALARYEEALAECEDSIARIQQFDLTGERAGESAIVDEDRAASASRHRTDRSADVSRPAPWSHAVLSVDQALGVLPRDLRDKKRVALVTIALAGLCLVVGGLTGFDVRLGVAALVLCVAPWVILHAKVALVILVATVYFGLFETGTITLNRAGAPLAAAAIIFYVWHRMPSLRHGRSVLRAVIVYVFTAVASLLWTLSPSATLHSLISLTIALLYMGAFALLVKDEDHLRTVLKSVTFCSAVLAIWWLVSYARGIPRFTNEAGDPNFFAAYQIVALPLTFALAVASRSRSLRSCLYALACLNLVSIISSLSRGGAITLGAVFLYILFVPARVLFSSGRQKAATLLASALAIVVVLLFVWSDLAERFTLDRARLGIWQSALHGYADRPLTGLGSGAYLPISYQLLRTTPGVRLDQYTTGQLQVGRVVHNLYVETLVELGPLGLLAMLGILSSTARLFIRLARPGGGPLRDLTPLTAAALGVGLVALSVTSLFLSPQTDRVLWMIIGLSLALANLPPHRGQSHPGPVKEVQVRVPLSGFGKQDRATFAWTLRRLCVVVRNRLKQGTVAAPRPYLNMRPKQNHVPSQLCRTLSRSHGIWGKLKY